MYNTLKRIIRKLISKKLLFRLEPGFRSILYLFYKGNNFECNICGKKLRTFINIKDYEKLCPKCGSISRNRRLWLLLESEFLKEGISVLDFSPSRSLYRNIKKNPKVKYISTDLSGDFIAGKNYDITKIDSANETYDLIICYHILEHITNDKAAMNELYRVLKKNGVCLIQTPFKEAEIYENFSIVSEHERLQYFGQEDHVRIYSVEGLKERLKKSGFIVDVRYYHDSQDNKFGFSTEETVLVCRKKE